MAITPNDDDQSPPPPIGHGGSGSASVPPEAAFDPYFLYAESTNFRFVRGNKDDFVPILLELTAPLDTFLVDGVFRPDPNADFIQISPLYTQAPAELRETPFVTALVLAAFFKKLREGALKFVRRFDYCAPLTVRQLWPDKRSFKLQGPPAPTGKAPLVVVGVVDDAIGFAHQRFRYRDAGGVERTRFHAFWIQGKRPPGAGLPGPLPSYGTVLWRNDIDALFGQSTLAGTIDEDRVYALAGQDFSGDAHKNRGRRAGHGTHVLDIAAGEESADATAATPAIIAAVELPIAVTADTSGAQLTSYALDGIFWIAVQAYLMGKARGASALPCVVNLSYGTLSGPHDGSDLLTRAIDFFISLWRDVLKERLSVVLPAGNGHLSQTHATVELPRGGQVETLRWRVLPDTKTPGFMEIWLPHDTLAQEIEVRVAAPGQAAGGWMAEGDPNVVWPAAGGELSRVIYHTVATDLGVRKLILISVYPTAEVAAGDPVAPWGIWHVELRNVGGASSRTVDAWIRRNDTPGGYPVRARQSRFDDDHYVNHRYRPDGRVQEVDDGLSPVWRKGTINGLATGRRAVAVGGCRRRDLSTAPYSAGGPTLPASAASPAPRNGPDALAPSDLSYARAGVLAAGMGGARAVSMRGTSVAAPQVTRLIAASMLAPGGQGTRAEIAGAGVAAEAAHKAPTVPPGTYVPAEPAVRGGSGRINNVPLPPANRLR